MNFKKIQNKFWARKASGEEGFTLVELIVVIAILGILAGVGTVAYSGYVKKANMTADQTLVSDVANAIILGYYAGVNTDEGFVVLSTDAVPSYAAGTISSEALEKCLKDAYGDDLSGMLLKYNDWNVEYQNSSYSGKESSLLNQVDNLSSALASTIETYPDVVGTKFNSFLGEVGLADGTSAEKADAAVLYIAQNSANISDTQRETYLNAIATYFEPNNAQNSTATIMNSFEGIGGLAATYAFAEAYFQYEAANDPNSTGLATLHAAFENRTVSDATEAGTILATAISDAMRSSNAELAGKYFAGGANSQAVKDAEAYLDIMQTISSAKDQIVAEIRGGTGFSNSATISDLLSNYADGGIILIAEKQDDGSMAVINPIAN